MLKAISLYVVYVVYPFAIGNKKLCLSGLEAKILVWQTEQLIEQKQIQWQGHNALERGNPVKTIKAELSN